MTKKHAAHELRYRNAAGKIVPSVTGIIGLVNKPALVHASWKLGIEGLNYREVWNEAAKIGTCSHKLVECFLKKRKPNVKDFSPAQLEIAQRASKNFKGWWEIGGFRLIESEVRLVSEVMQCGGTLDIVAYLPKTATFWDIDIKTSKDVYPEMLYQQAAYWAMWNELHPKQPLAGVCIIQLDKTNGNLTPHWYDNLFAELEIFRHLRMVYGLQKDKDKRALQRLQNKFDLERI